MPESTQQLAQWIDAQEPKMTRADFARKIEVSEPHLSLFLNGKKRISLRVAVNIEAATGGAFKPSDLVAA